MLAACPAALRATSAMQAYVEAMQPGWNLGNTLDAIPDETSWGNPLVTRELIEEVAAQGFKSIRIPVTWDDHVGPAPDYAVDPAWMDRVEQIVGWSLDAGLYVMLNVHHDSGEWVKRLPTNREVVLARFDAIWRQIAARFREHSDRLMFESINEPDFERGDEATRAAWLEELNRRFFEIVRSSGGPNATRPLVLPAMRTNGAQLSLDALMGTFMRLDDPHLIATVHYYGFWPFSINLDGFTTFNDRVIEDIETQIDDAHDTFVARGIPVIVGEYGLIAFDKDHHGTAVERGEMLKFFEHYTHYARARGLTHMWWDNGQHLNRTTHEWRDPVLYETIMHSLTGRSSSTSTDLIFLPKGAPVRDVALGLNLHGNEFVSLADSEGILKAAADYTVVDGKLTIKADVLAAHAQGDLGEKEILTARFSAGPAWQIRVLHADLPTLARASGDVKKGMAIPVAFHGDLLATMQATYENGENAGPQAWTAYQEYLRSFAPDYAHNRITLLPEFFASTSGKPVNLTFHFWSGRTASYRLTIRGDRVTGRPVSPPARAAD